ncbi:CRISPR-associated protein [Saccharolobus islandicus]|uniref:CRISPR-associated protein n=1 Tax=Saccharolobus islandicus LAL14/1 TaxID=1241935 RepID=M9U7N0_SACIS|nr:CRISPR-associated protein [Sulfolobus islandicus]AGJ62093.1 CRISPR-associated protein [Sulfolobus islandicus LAL14/1]
MLQTKLTIFLAKNEYVKIHLSAVGTSLLRNVEEGDPKIKDKLINLGLEKWYNLSLDDKKQRIIVQNRSELKVILSNFIREKGSIPSLILLLADYHIYTNLPIEFILILSRSQIF